MSNGRKTSGMTLIELLIVIGILGILFAAVYMFFVKGTEQFHFARRQNELATSGRLALEILSDEIIWAGYMPQGGWTEDQWHPVEVATNTTFSFYADREPFKSLQDEDHRNIFLGTDNILRVTDDGSMTRVAGTNIVSLQFNYLDAAGNYLAEPLDSVTLDAVRHIEIKIVLQDTYMGDVYQTIMETTVTPRNLGVVHNFDPLFYQPPPIDAKIVVNIDGDSTLHTPTIHQEALITQLDNWGFTMVDLTDDELSSYDYDSSGVDLIILRNITPTGDHSSISAALQAIELPIIALDPDDAVNVFGMGMGPHVTSSSHCIMHKVFEFHPIHEGVPDPFIIYDDSTGVVTWLDSLTNTDPNDGHTYLITGFDSDSISGVSVRWEDSLLTMRRVFYCAPDFHSYSDDGLTYLLNVILWSLPEASPPPLGEEINEVEGFEGDSPGDVLMTLWEDDLENGEMLPDSLPLMTDFIPGGAVGMVWLSSSEGSGQITRLGDNTLEMHRTSTGAFDRNISVTSADLSAYDALSDDLYITAETWKGTSETINAEDGIFLYSAGSSTVELASEDFESLILGGGDVEYWGDLYGRHRIHSPGWNNPTSFVTLDSRNDTDYGRSRMIIELDTSTLTDGSTITVYYRMTDHRDETHNYNSTTKSGDYIGWSLGNDIDDAVQGYTNLSPALRANGVWNSYEYSFTPPGAMPSTIYVIFSQYDNQRATGATDLDGISFDDIQIVASNVSIDLDRVGVPSSDADWQRVAVDLDDETASLGENFTVDFGIALSQYGMGSWPTHGLHWRNFELGVIDMYYSVPGWQHDPMLSGGIDDWSLESISGNHKWTLHANDPVNYSDNSYCWLQTPTFSIPASAEGAVLSFDQSVNFESNYDYGWVEVTTNGGVSWLVCDISSYNGATGGHGAFTGNLGSSTVDIDLSPYVGQTVSFRFVFDSDYSVVRSGWILDNFEATCTVSGVSIESIGFKPVSPGGGWYFNEVNVWLGGVAESAFLGDGEWDKNDLTFAGTYDVLPAVSGDWVIIDLDEPFILPAATNLFVKMEMNQTGATPGYSWVAANRSDLSRYATSASADPTYLTVADVRPAFMINTTASGQKFVDADSTATSLVMPLAFSSLYGDFEAIYMITELGFSGDVTWEHGGTNDDWEFGAPVFIPDVDPALEAANQNNIAGNDLTVNGFYMADSWNWLRSCPYPMADAAAYDSVAVAFDRCLRRSHNDYAYVFMAFTDTPDAPTSESDWILVKTCDYDDVNWETDVIQLTEYFQDALAQGKQYYFIRFVMDSGPFAENGGWNLDNVGFYGRYAI